MSSISLKEKAQSILDYLKQKIVDIRYWNKRNINNLAGLDIGPESIKLLKINSSITPYMVENFAISTLPAGAIIKDEIKDYSSVASAINEAIRQSGITTKDVAIGIPRSLVISKNITIDSRLTLDEIESRAWIEASRHFPELVGDIYLDFTIVGPSVSDPSQSELMLIACRKEHINPYLEVLHQCNLRAKIVDVNSYALERALKLIDQPPTIQTIALLNLNVNLSSLIVVHDKTLIHAHDQSYDGVRLISQTQEYLKTREATGVSTELIDDPQYNNILRESLISHLRHTMHFFYSSRPNISIQKIILSGDCARIPNLFLFIQREIGIETEVSNPFAAMALTSTINAEEFKKHASALMLCCGLALSKLKVD